MHAIVFYGAPESRRRPLRSSSTLIIPACGVAASTRESRAASPNSPVTEPRATSVTSSGEMDKLRELVRRDRRQKSTPTSRSGSPAPGARTESASTAAGTGGPSPAEPLIPPAPTALTEPVPGCPPPDTAAADDDTTSDTVPDNLWSLAYKALLEREPDLIADYERHIGARPDGQDDAARASVLSSPSSVKSVVKGLQDDRENKQWKVSIRGKDHKVRDQLEKLVKLLTLSDSVIKQALSAQPYAALAWSAVSVFLPVSLF